MLHLHFNTVESNLFIYVSLEDLWSMRDSEWSCVRICEEQH